MNFAPVIVAVVIVAVAAVLIGRLWLLLIPPVGWSVLFVGLHRGWWGAGVGDFWQLAFAIDVAVSEALVGIGLWLHHLFTPSDDRDFR